MAVGLISAGAGVLSAGAGLLGGGKASSAAKDAAAQQMQMYQMTRADLSPFTQAGAGVLPALNALSLSGPTGGGPDYVTQAAGERPLQMTQNALEQTPGYQFTRDQGLKAVQSATAARGLGVSGASLKGAATYATGLANTTYKDQFALQQKRFEDLLALSTGQQDLLKNQYVRLHDTAAIGSDAAARVGTAGTNAAATAGGFTNAAGVNQSNALNNATGALSSGVNNYLGYNAFQNAMNPTSGYGNAASGSSVSASGNPVMTGFAPSVSQDQIRAGYLPSGYA